MIKIYVTMGFQHVHKINNKIIDRNCVAEIIKTREDLSDVEFCNEYFDKRYSRVYRNIEDVGLEYYPRGVIKL